MNSVWFIFVVYFVMCFGLSSILIDGVGPWHILEKWHNWMLKHTPNFEELFSCFMCFPTVLGFILSTLNIVFFPTFPLTPMNICLFNICPWWVIIPLDGFVTSGGVWLIHNFQRYLQSFANE